jgi:glutaredoxin
MKEQSSRSRREGVSGVALPEVIIYSKPDCCLCDKAKEQLKRLQVKHSFALREINILEDLESCHAFRDEIPVIFVNGRKAFKYGLDEKQFARLLTAG